MKSLLLPLALCAALAGCTAYAPYPYPYATYYTPAPYQSYDPVTGTWQTYTPESGAEVLAPFVYPYPYEYPYPYPYSYANPYWYDPFWFAGGAFFGCCGSGHVHHGHGHWGNGNWHGNGAGRTAGWSGGGGMHATRR